MLSEKRIREIAGRHGYSGDEPWVADAVAYAIESHGKFNMWTGDFMSAGLTLDEYFAQNKKENSND